MGLTKVITVTVSPALDLTIRLGSILPGAVNKAYGQDMECGGKGINVARSLRRLGMQVTAAGFLGEENAALFADFFREAGIADEFIRISGRTRTNVKIITDDRRTTDINSPGTKVGREEEDALFERLAPHRGSDAVFVLTGGLPAGLDSGFYARAVTFLREGGSEVWLDASGAALAEGLKAGPAMAKPNSDELAEAFGQPAKSMEDMKAQAHQYIDGGVGWMAVTLGADGALLVNAHEAFYVKPPKITPYNTVGAGDVFLSGLIYGRASGWNGKRQLAFAAALSAYHVESGVGRFDRAAIDRMAEALAPASI